MSGWGALATMVGVTGAGFGSGYLDEKDRQKERARRDKLDQIQFDRADREKQEHAYMQRYRDEMLAASAPTEVASDEGYQPAVDDDGNQMPANPSAGTYRAGGRTFPSMADAQSHAKERDAPAAMQARQVQTMSRYDPTGALKLQSAQLGLEQDQATMRIARKAEVIKEAQGILLAGGWGAVSEVFGRYNNGYHAKAAPDGKGGAVVSIFDQSGKHLGDKPYANMTEFIREASAQLDPDKWISAQDARADKDRQQKNSDREFGLLERRQLETERHNQASEGLLRERVTGAATPAPLWGDKDDTFLRDRYTMKDPNTGAEVVDGHGMAFAKQIALARARESGGDTTSALGRAMDVDRMLKENAGNDPAKLRALRDGYLNALTAPPQQESTADRVKRWAAANGDAVYDIEVDGQPRVRAGEKKSKPSASMSSKPAGPGWMSRLRDRAGELLAPNWESHAQGALGLKDASAIRQLLASPEAMAALSAETVERLRAAAPQ